MLNFQRLRDIREDHDLSQDQLAIILNVKRSTYSLWELGINIIPINDLYNFAYYFGYSIDYILGLSNNKKAKYYNHQLDRQLLGNNIHYLRIKQGLSQENIAQLLDVSQACIYRYEKGLITISLSNLYVLCKNFCVTFDEICCKQLSNDKISSR